MTHAVLGGGVMIPKAFEPFLRKTPVCLLAKAAIRNLFEPDRLNTLFEQMADTQYHRTLLFSDVFHLMLTVVLRTKPTVWGAYQEADLPVSHQAVYDKLKRMDGSVTEALVVDAATRVRETMTALGVAQPEPIAGLRARILDGNLLGGTQRRLKPLRKDWAPGLPGRSLVVYEPSSDLVTHLFLEPDGHASERSRLDDVLALAATDDLWIADAHYCIHEFMTRIQEANACFLVRHHATMTGHGGQVRECLGRTTNGMVYETPFPLMGPNEGWTIRRLTLVLDTPTSDGVTEVHVLTNVPKERGAAAALLAAYRDRWQIERRFFEMSQTLGCEPDTLGYPPAALFAFGLVASNAMALIKAAMQTAHPTKNLADLSHVRLARELRDTDAGLMVAIPTKVWRYLDAPTPPKLAVLLLTIAGHVTWDRYLKSSRGPKKPPPKKIKHKSVSNLSTHRELQKHQKGKGRYLAP